MALQMMDEMFALGYMPQMVEPVKCNGHPGETRIQHYSSLNRILLVGEGDFSFSSCLATAFGSAKNIIATSLDTFEQVFAKYSKVGHNLSNLLLRGAIVLHNVNVKTMIASAFLSSKRFDRIIFNFPHAGFFGQPETDESVIEKHKELMGLFFLNASKLLMHDGEIHVAHKLHGPYEKWDLENLAKASGLMLKNALAFDVKNYPGYVNLRGDGKFSDQTFLLGRCKTFVFALSESCSRSLSNFVADCGKLDAFAWPNPLFKPISQFCQEFLTNSHRLTLNLADCGMKRKRAFITSGTLETHDTVATKRLALGELSFSLPTWMTNQINPNSTIMPPFDSTDNDVNHDMNYSTHVKTQSHDCADAFALQTPAHEIGGIVSQQRAVYVRRDGLPVPATSWNGGISQKAAIQSIDHIHNNYQPIYNPSSQGIPYHKGAAWPRPTTAPAPFKSACRFPTHKVHVRLNTASGIVRSSVAPDTNQRAGQPLFILI